MRLFNTVLQQMARVQFDIHPRKIQAGFSASGLQLGQFVRVE